MGLKRGHKARPLEWVAEKFIFLVSLSAIIVIFLIFLFVVREALPIFLGRMNSSLAGEVIPVEKMSTMSDKELMAYLDLTPSQLEQLDEQRRNNHDADCARQEPRPPSIPKWR